MTYYIGIDLGGTNTVAGIVDEEGKLLHKRAVKTPKNVSFQVVISAMEAAVRAVLDDAEMELDQIQAVGIGSPGIVDSKAGKVVFATNLPFIDRPVAHDLSEALGGIRTFIMNDANAAALGEFKVGAGKDVKSMVALTLGTGIGSGIILEGDDGMESAIASAEFGHMIIREGGRQCLCGNNGCLEMYASATGLIMTTKEVMRSNPDSSMWNDVGGDVERVNGLTPFKAMQSGDRAGAAVIETYLNTLAAGITNIINIVQPALICVGGGVSRQGETLLEPLRVKVRGMNLSQFKDGETIIANAKLGNDAGIIGSALFARDRG